VAPDGIVEPAKQRNPASGGKPPTQDMENKETLRFL